MERVWGEGQGWWPVRSPVMHGPRSGTQHPHHPLFRSQCRPVQSSAGQCHCGTCPRYLPQVPPHPWYLYPSRVPVPCAPVVAWLVPLRMFPHRPAPGPTFWLWLSSRPPLLTSVSSPIFIILHRCRNYSFFSSSLTSLSFPSPHHTTNRIRRYYLTIQVTNVCVFPFVRRPLDSGSLA